MHNKNIDCSLIEELKMICIKEREIYQVMNMLRIHNMVAKGIVWI